MKLFQKYVFVVFLVFLFGCQQQQRPFTEAEQKAVQKEVKTQFSQLVSAINIMDAGAWAESYSKDSFISAMAHTDYYDERGAWVDLVKKYFAMRESQTIEPLDVRVSALTPELALLTSEENSKMTFKDGKNVNSKHVFTMIWKKEKDGWKILHSHESWTETPAK